MSWIRTRYGHHFGTNLSIVQNLVIITFHWQLNNLQSIFKDRFLLAQRCQKGGDQSSLYSHLKRVFSSVLKEMGYCYFCHCIILLSSFCNLVLTDWIWGLFGTSIFGKLFFPSSFLWQTKKWDMAKTSHKMSYQRQVED